MGKDVLKTELCEMLGIEYPIFLAGMGALPGMPRIGKYYTGTSIELVAEVSNAGGFGVLGAVALTPEQIPEAVEEIKARTSKPFGIDLIFPSEMERVAQEVIDQKKASLQTEHREYYAWMDQIREKYRLPKRQIPEYLKRFFDPAYIRDQFEAAVSCDGPVAVCSGVGTTQWAVERIHKEGKLSISLVGNVRQARKVAKLGTDIIVAQGTEAGGHTGKIGTMALVPQVVDEVSPVPVLAAGGIADGRGVAAAFALGAKGVWVGTAFLSSRESVLTDECLQKIIEADETTPVITPFFTGKTARILSHPIAEEWEKAGYRSLGMPLQIFSVVELLDGMEGAGRTDLYILPAGQIAGMIRRVKPAREIFNEMVSTSVKILKGAELEHVTVIPGNALYENRDETQ